MKRIIHLILMLFAFIATQVNGVLVYEELRNSSGEITYDSVSVFSKIWKFSAEYKDNHTLFISVEDVSMYGHISEENSFGCRGWLYLPEKYGICQKPLIKCLFYQPVECILPNTATLMSAGVDGMVCNKYMWFRLSKMPEQLKIFGQYFGRKFVQVQYKYLECLRNEKEYSTTVTDSSTDQTSSVTAYDATSNNLPQIHVGTELIVGLAIAIGLLVISWVVLGVVIIRNRSKATSRTPDVKVTDAEESNTREIVVNAIYGENFDRMVDDSQQTSSSAVYSMVHK
uniref:uncharacterized protein LOC120328859 n=2 Tax=Styela clava TaxID=7725 RepID=UPI00193A3B9B|nr:uncharacterized protein LOC120328859 [Styela clava]